MPNSIPLLSDLVPIMEFTSLQSMHGSSIEVVLDINGRAVTVRGRGCFKDDAELGNVLHVEVQDPAGNFEIVLQESACKSHIEAAPEAGVDFRIHLVTSVASVSS